MSGFGFEYVITGTNRVANKLRKIASQMPELFDKSARPWGQETRAALKATKYPPRRPKQKYIRTGRLARGWGASRIKPGQWQITNSTPYTVYVVDRKKQAWMHRGRWWIAQDVIEGRLHFMRADFERNVKKMWEAG